MTGLGAERDPLSVKYDTAVRHVLLQAVAAHKQGRGVKVWVHSPAHELRELDGGGLTASERAFLRAAFYQVTKVPPRHWSLRRTWGPRMKRGGRWYRLLSLRLYRYGSGYRAVQAGKRTAWWDDPARRSSIGNRAPAQ
jgi:hypothetical protein